MVLNNCLDIANMYRTQFTDDCIEREIVYDPETHEFTSVTGSYGCNIIENIYADILPIYVELIQRQKEDLVVKDTNGRLTLISVMPF